MGKNIFLHVVFEAILLLAPVLWSITQSGQPI